MEKQNHIANLIASLKVSYSLMFEDEIEVYIYKRSVGIYLHGNFVFFLSHSYIKQVYDIDIPSRLVVNPGKINIPAAVKREKLNRTKLNK